jgi:hypothetical protein
VDPRLSYTGTANVTLYSVPPDVTGTITPGGAPVVVTITTPGQNASLTFQGTSGQRVSLKAPDATIWSSTVKILNPDGSTLWTGFSTLNGVFMDTRR